MNAFFFPAFKRHDGVFRNRLSIHMVQNPESTKSYAEKTPPDPGPLPLSLRLLSHFRKSSGISVRIYRQIRYQCRISFLYFPYKR